MSMSALKTFIKELRQRLPIDLIVNVMYHKKDIN